MADRREPLHMGKGLMLCPDCRHEWMDGPHRCPACDPIGQRLERKRTGNETLLGRVITAAYAGALIGFAAWLVFTLAGG